MHLKEGALLKGGTYRIERVLGQGGFGITYLAIQSGLNRQVAVKEFFMKEHCERDSTTSYVTLGTVGSKDLVGRFKEKFIKEAQTIAEMDNHHIIRIIEVFEDNGTAYYVMEYLPGGCLNDMVPAYGLPESVALGYISQLADALAYIHEEKKILHLDVKPSNVLFRRNGEAVLIDFGISKHYDDEGGSQTSSTPVGVSRGYAPLEQYKRGGVSQFTPATDVYSLGATLYKLLTGQTPPDADEINEDGLPDIPSSVSLEVRQAVEKAMSPRRKDRPQTVRAFLQLLNSEPSRPAKPMIVIGEDTQITIGDSYPSHKPKQVVHSRPTVTSRPPVASRHSVTSKPTVPSKPVAPHSPVATLPPAGASKKQPQVRKSRRGLIWGLISGGLVLTIIIIATLSSAIKNRIAEEAYMSYQSGVEAAEARERNERAREEAERQRREREEAAARKEAEEKQERERKEREEAEKKLNEIYYRDGVLYVKGAEYRMVYVSGGTFTMGGTAEQGSDAYSDEKPAHRVSLSSYSIGKYEVTNELWDAVMNTYKSNTYGARKPVEDVSWKDCKDFITKLNQLTGRYFRLPTEAEWEFAARGGNSSRGYKYSGSNSLDDVAWYGNTNLHTVGGKSPNELGIYDMSGNVWEWCSDWKGSYSSDFQSNPRGPSVGEKRVCRGGSAYDNPRNCRVSYREENAPDFSSGRVGFRLCL